VQTYRAALSGNMRSSVPRCLSLAKHELVEKAETHPLRDQFLPFFSVDDHHCIGESIFSDLLDNVGHIDT
jgi:hypothetical protein